MGAVFAYKKNEVHNIIPALELFAEMGFSSPTCFESNEWKIYTFQKMITNTANFVSDRDCTIISTGTPLYKGLNYTDSLTALLQDYLSGGFDREQLIGQYTILFCKKDHIKILCDPLGCKHLFTDQNYNMISSHMLPICQCLHELHVNRKAVYEKLLTGIIMSPATLFTEIVQIDKQIAEFIARKKFGLSFMQWDRLKGSATEAKSFSKCITEQANCLCEYFKLLNASGKEGIDIGLSGGYDSRLVLACLHMFNDGRVHLHSHATEDIHRKELAIANLMADYIGTPCHIVATKKLENSDNVDDILRKSVLYFDGRSSFSIGGCGEVYTASYRIESTEKIGFTLTGVGGELYRNVFDIGYRNIRFDRFMEDKIFSHCFRKAVPNKLYYEIKDDIIRKTAKRLGVDYKKKQTRKVAYRYYCEILMPDGQGVALDAYNQVSFCIAPFLESRIIAKGYESIPYHYSGGEFEGKLIDYIDPKLAALPSIYGYPIGNRPLKAKIKESLRTYIPTSVWNRLALSAGKTDTKSIEAALVDLYANSLSLKEAYSFLTELFPEITFSSMLISNEDIRRVQFVAMTLYMFRERIKAN